jgi:hypothetical protein
MGLAFDYAALRVWQCLRVSGAAQLATGRDAVRISQSPAAA